MERQRTTALYVVLMVAVIVSIDVLFFNNCLWERLTVNISNRSGIRRLLFQIPETSMNGTWLLTSLRTGW
jgi:hypothetical protein